MPGAPRKSVKKQAQARATKSKPPLEGADRFTIMLEESRNSAKALVCTKT
jgi:hypothetical protein